MVSVLVSLLAASLLQECMAIDRHKRLARHELFHSAKTASVTVGSDATQVVQAPTEQVIQRPGSENTQSIEPPTLTVSSCTTPFSSTGCMSNGGNCNMAFIPSTSVCVECVEVPGSAGATEMQITSTNAGDLNPVTVYCGSVTSVQPAVVTPSTEATVCATPFLSSGCMDIADGLGGNCTTVFVNETSMCEDCVPGTEIRITGANIALLHSSARMCDGSGVVGSGINESGLVTLAPSEQEQQDATAAAAAAANGTEGGPCTTVPFASLGCVSEESSEGENCTFVFIPSTNVCAECFQDTTVRMTPDTVEQLDFAVTFCNPVAGNFVPGETAAGADAEAEAEETSTTVSADDAIAGGDAQAAAASGELGVRPDDAEDAEATPEDAAAAKVAKLQAGMGGKPAATPVSHIIVVLAVALVIIFLPAAYVTYSGKEVADGSDAPLI